MLCFSSVLLCVEGTVLNPVVVLGVVGLNASYHQYKQIAALLRYCWPQGLLICLASCLAKAQATAHHALSCKHWVWFLQAGQRLGVMQHVCVA